VTGVQTCALPILAGLLGAFHLGRKEIKKEDSDAAG